MTMPQPTQAELAYQLWQSRGFPDGSSEQDWFEAGRRIQELSQTTRARMVPDVVSDGDALAPPVEANEGAADSVVYPAEGI